jgi:thiopeptide-type bacteriocin biosynthesis protein
MPRIIALHDGDNVLPVDLDNSLSVDAFVDVVHDRSEAQISEALDHVMGATATGRGGSFVHELVVPFTNGAPAKASAARAKKPKIAAALARELVPGSEWLYAKLYCGEATADEVLTRVVQPFVKDALGSKAIDRWFFIRYADPHPHLRVRVHGQPAALAKLLPELAERLGPFTRSGRVWKVQADTYVREVERYGGPIGMPICEALFGCDSEAAARLVALGCTERERWGALLVSIDAMLKDLGLDLEARARFEEKRAADFAREFRMHGDFEHGLAKAYRRERAYVEALLAPKEGESEVLARVRKVIEARSKANAPHVRALRAAEREKRLTASVETILASLVHMTVIRMARSYPRQQELVLHTYLSRTYESMIARERKKKGTEAAQ